jgi:purine-cytosine permease-like protein
MQLLALLFVVVVLVAIVGFVVMLILSLLFMLAMACAIGIPIYLIARHYMGGRNSVSSGPSPMERLKNLYIEGKIDLFEYEQRVAKLIAIEH